MAVKTGNFLFRVPAELREALDRARKATEQSQSDFIGDATLEFIALIRQGTPIRDLLLEDGFTIPSKDSKMVNIRVDPDLPELVKRVAPRLYHSASRLFLWATTYKIRQLEGE